jgi:hypothetical protein
LPLKEKQVSTAEIIIASGSALSAALTGLAALIRALRRRQ